MNKKYDDLAQKLFSVSEIISVLYVVFFILSLLTYEALPLALGSKWTWLIVISKPLFVVALLMIAVSWPISGVLFILGYPNIAFAWFQGQEKGNLSRRSWDQLPNGKKSFVFVLSIIQLVVTLFGIIAWAINYSKS